MTAAWIIAFGALLVGLLLVLSGRGMRQRRGLTDGRTLDMDGRNLYSARHRLACRPDRVVEEDGIGIPEEWKSARHVYQSHRAQIGVQFIVIEDETGVRPPHGSIVTDDGTRQRIENTPELRAWVLDVADQIRAARRQMAECIQVKQPGKKKMSGTEKRLSCINVPEIGS